MFQHILTTIFWKKTVKISLQYLENEPLNGLKLIVDICNLLIEITFLKNIELSSTYAQFQNVNISQFRSVFLFTHHKRDISHFPSFSRWVSPLCSPLYFLMFPGFWTRRACQRQGIDGSSPIENRSVAPSTSLKMTYFVQSRWFAPIFFSSISSCLFGT